mmetsp:Transcript_79733/g.140645  ORF Transcript_79733/g.140645 Transcript_79733/m.140645 type:complete len:308 (+) Transcript_79733:1192-2115(+)
MRRKPSLPSSCPSLSPHCRPTPKGMPPWAACCCRSAPTSSGHCSGSCTGRPTHGLSSERTSGGPACECPPSTRLASAGGCEPSTSSWVGSWPTPLGMARRLWPWRWWRPPARPRPCSSCPRCPPRCPRGSFRLGPRSSLCPRTSWPSGRRRLESSSGLAYALLSCMGSKTWKAAPSCSCSVPMLSCALPACLSLRCTSCGGWEWLGLPGPTRPDPPGPTWTPSSSCRPASPVGGSLPSSGSTGGGSSTTRSTSCPPMPQTSHGPSRCRWCLLGLGGGSLGRPLSRRPPTPTASGCCCVSIWAQNRAQ